jgi:ubiquinone/menaquinone biosynthesis C-methylase UbiE
MGIYDKYLLPKLVHYACRQKPNMRQREKVVPLARGRVLEIGFGSGLNWPLYRADRVDHLWALEPSADMLAMAQRNVVGASVDAEFIQSGAESIPLDDNSADSVLMTYTLCTIPDPITALNEIRRVLKPAGQLIFCEHGRAPDKSVENWQKRLNPIWTKFSGGCNLNRPVPLLLDQAGFKCPGIETMYLPGWKMAGFNYWGTATY